MPEFRRPIGTQDILPPDSSRWEAVVARFAGIAEAAGYGLVLGPLFEDHDFRYESPQAGSRPRPSEAPARPSPDR